MAVAFTRDPFAPRRRHTREVRVGDVGVGGENPIRVQSMTTTNTLDTRATVDQCERLVAAGCEIVRITAPSLREAENLGEIARVLRGRGITAPLVADIHFTPNAALVAAEHVEKVRINPGNFADKKRFAVREYTDAEYRSELERVASAIAISARFEHARENPSGATPAIGVRRSTLAAASTNASPDRPTNPMNTFCTFIPPNSIRSRTSYDRRRHGTRSEPKMERIRPGARGAVRFANSHARKRVSR